MIKKYLIFLIILLAFYSCNKENAVIRIYFKNNTDDTVYIDEYKDNLLYHSFLDTNKYKLIEEGIYGSYIPTSLISTKYDSIKFFFQNDTVVFSRWSKNNNNPFNDNNAWKYNKTYSDSRCSFKCKYFTVYEYYYSVK